MNSNVYDNFVKKSYFTDKNLSGKYSPKSLSDNMIDCNKLPEFHYQTSFFLHLCTALYIELKKLEKENDYNIIKFSEFVNNLKININTEISDPPKLSNFNSTTNVFTFYYKVITIPDNLSNPSIIYTIDGNKYYSRYGFDDDFKRYIPNFGGFPTILTNFPDIFNNVVNNNYNYDKTNIDNLNDTTKLKNVLKQILVQTPENIIGYLLYQRINYNIILYNIDIQNSIRRNYLNNTSQSFDITSPALDTKATPRISFPFTTQNDNIIGKVNDNIENLRKISQDTFDVNDYIVEKNNYKNKINVFNNLKKEYAKTLDKLNISIKLYNQQLTNYNKIKNYATYMIIVLIIIMIFIIVLSIFPIFKNDTKNAIYIIIFIVLLILTFIYYTSFKYVVLYENFGTASSSELTGNQTLIVCLLNSLLTIPTSSNNPRKNHADFYNFLLPVINNYSNTINDLLNDLRINVSTIGSKSFSQDANIIVYNLYLQKKKELANNNIRLTNLFNMIEIIKKQISYLFNFVFIVCCLCLILLLGLVLYSSVPQLYLYIIILCIILISILMIYFAFAIIQPTRMIANKNYWAIVNPTKNTMGKL